MKNSALNNQYNYSESKLNTFEESINFYKGVMCYDVRQISEAQLFEVHLLDTYLKQY